MITFSLCHPAACQGTATPTACWESWWARARGRWRRRRRESSASGRERRSWRNAPAPRRCYPPGASRWLRSNQRLSTQCGKSTLCCEYSSFVRLLGMVICVICRIHSFIYFTLTAKAVSLISAALCHLCEGIKDQGVYCPHLLTVVANDSTTDFSCFLTVCFLHSEIDDVYNDLLHLDIW